VGGADSPRRLADAPLYATFGESWRVSQADSLFDDLPGQDVARYTNRQIPNADASTTVDTARRYAAAALCAKLGVTDPTILAACILDVALTGDPTFALGAATAQTSFGGRGSGAAGGSGKTVSVTVPTDVSGTLGVAGAADRYTFAGKAGAVLFLSSQACPSTPLHWSLVGPDGAPVPGTSSPGVCTAIGRVELPSDGQYTVVISAPADLAAAATYAIDIRTVAPDDGFTISVGDEVSFNHPKPGMGYLESAGIHHRYQFTAPASGVIELDSASVCGQDLSWTLTDASGRVVGSSLPQCTSFGKMTLTPGAGYTITIAGADVTSLGVGQYGFTLAQAKGELTASAPASGCSRPPLEAASFVSRQSTAPLLRGRPIEAQPPVWATSRGWLLRKRDHAAGVWNIGAKLATTGRQGHCVPSWLTTSDVANVCPQRPRVNQIEALGAYLGRTAAAPSSS